MNISGSCLDGGVDIYEQNEGQLRLAQQGVIVDQTASVVIDNIILDVSYFASVSGENSPIIGLTATPQGSNVISNIPVNSHLALLVMMLGIIIFAVNRRVL